MEGQSLRPYIIVVCLMAFTCVALAVSVDVHVSNEAGVGMEIPDEFGQWTGSEIRFCQKQVCQQAVLTAQLEDPDVCPACGEPLYTMSRIEAQLLPPDTGMLKKHFKGPGNKAVNVSIVLSGKERGSIHRPEVCQTGQGRDLVKREVIEVPIEGRKPLKIMVLYLLSSQTGPDGQSVESGSYYAYWFVGKDRETPYHLMRMFLMAADRITRNVAHRWAYISVAGSRELGSEDFKDEIRSVVAELYPHMMSEAS